MNNDNTGEEKVCENCRRRPAELVVTDSATGGQQLEICKWCWRENDRFVLGSRDWRPDRRQR